MVSGATVKREKLASYYARDDYYFPHGEDNVNVLGSGAKIFGFDRLRVPTREAFSRLVVSREIKALDLTLSPPKSLSILFAAGNPEGRKVAIEVHEKACAELLAYIEMQGFFQAVKKEYGVTHSYPAKGMLVLPINHSLSRNNDPLLHSHCLIANAGIIRGEDQVRAVNFHLFFRNQKHFDHVYKSFLRGGLDQNGFPTRTTKDGFELAEITRRQIEVFSSRSQQIHRNLAQKGLTRETASAKQRQAACLQGRKRKKNLDPFRLQEAWSMIAHGLGIRLYKKNRIKERESQIDTQRKIISLALDEYLEARMTATRKEIVDFILQHVNQVAADHGNQMTSPLSVSDIKNHLSSLLEERFLIRLPGQRVPEGDCLSEKLISFRLLQAEQSASEYRYWLPEDSTLGLFHAGVELEREGSVWLKQLALSAQNRKHREALIQIRRRALAKAYGMFSKAPKMDRDSVNTAQAESREAFHTDLQGCHQDRPSNRFMSPLEKLAKKNLDAWRKQTQKEDQKFAADKSRARFTNHYHRQNKFDSQLADQLEALQNSGGLKHETIRILAELEEIEQKTLFSETHSPLKGIDSPLPQMEAPAGASQIPASEEDTEEPFSPRR